MKRIPFPLKKYALPLFVALALIGCVEANPRTDELRVAYEQYMTIVTDAQITLDTQRLSEVATSSRLEQLISGIEARRKFSQLVSEEFSISSVSVTSYTTIEAVAEIVINYRGFVQDLDTGEREYSAFTDRWYWRRERVVFVFEDEKWKVKNNEFIDWSQ